MYIYIMYMYNIYIYMHIYIFQGSNLIKQSFLRNLLKLDTRH